MKKCILQISAIALFLTLVVTSCKKSSPNATTYNQPVEEQALQAKANEVINNNLNEVASQSKLLDELLNNATLNTGRHNKNIVQVAQSLPIFKSLVAAVVKCGLAETLSTPNLNATVFAPTDNAFAKLPAPFNNATNITAITNENQISFLKSVLLYHVLGSKVAKSAVANGRSSATTLKTAAIENDNKIYLSKNYGLLLINGNSRVVKADVGASNGIIHVIDNVLLFPTQNIAEVATSNPNFTTLVAALVKTNLVGVFTGKGDFTVFAPTNDAFAKLPAPFKSAESINAITDQATIDALANILKYHVTSSRYFAFDLGIFSKIETIASAPNNKITGILGFDCGFVKGKSNEAFSKIKPANILTTNGVVNVIDKVLLP